MSTGHHTEFFGPDLARGPFSSSWIETAVIQIATALAQLRAPLARSDSDIEAHADFIRGLADRLAPDYAAYLALDVGDKVSQQIATMIRTKLDAVSLLDCWLTDTWGGGLTATTPDTVTWNTGTVLETIVTKKRYLILTPTTGVAQVTVGHGGAQTWRWAVARHGRVYYSAMLEF